MPQPSLTFFCELDATALQSLFSSPTLIEDLKALRAKVSMGILDLSLKRAETVRLLNHQGIPVTAWLLLPKEQGYWFNLDNYPYARSFYQTFLEWTRQQGLVWNRIGIDIEPDFREIQRFFQNKWSLLPLLIRRIFEREKLKYAQSNYRNFVNQIHADGYIVESYQFPIMVDERMLKSTFIQRICRIVDIPSDCEVLMLYSHLLRPLGMGILWSYAPHAQAIAVGSTGGGMDGELAHFRPLSWQEFERDVRLSWHWCDNLYIFSLEGCIQQGYLERLKTFEWDKPMLAPFSAAQKATRIRSILHAWLWLTTHPTLIVFTLASLLWFVAHIRHMRTVRR